MGHILTIEQAADMLHLNPQVVRQYLREGKLPGAKIGRHWRIVEDDLSAFMRASHLGGAGVPYDRGRVAQEPEPGSHAAHEAWLALSQEERERRANAAYGLCASGKRTVDDFLREKHEEIDEEERRAEQRHEAWLQRKMDETQ